MKPFDVAIAGEINLDLILYGLPQQMPLERELLASGFRLTLGSSSAIVAHNLAALGSRVSFTTMVGSDDLGRIALERLSSSGVDAVLFNCRPTRPKLLCVEHVSDPFGSMRVLDLKQQLIGIRANRNYPIALARPVVKVDADIPYSAFAACTRPRR